MVGSDARLQQLIEVGIGSCLQHMMLSSDLHCQLAALFTMPLLLGNGADIVKVLGDASAVQNILSLLKSSVNEVLVGACQTIQIMASNPITHSKLMELKCTAALIKLFDTGTLPGTYILQKQQEYSLTTLQALCFLKVTHFFFQYFFLY